MSYISNDMFWIYFLSVCFPNAYDEENDIALCDFMAESYECDEKFIDGLTQYTEGIFDMNDGYVENPNTIEIDSGGHEFKIEFHAGDTIFFLDGKKIGNTGGHFIISGMSTEIFMELIHNIHDKRIPLLFMPVLRITENDTAIKSVIENSLCALECLKAEDIPYITDMIFQGII